MEEQISEDIKKQRLDELMLCQQKIAFAKNRERIGGKLVCLVDSVNNDSPAKGRYYGQAPEIDSVCIINKCSTGPGRFVETKVVGMKDYDLIVERI